MLRGFGLERAIIAFHCIAETPYVSVRVAEQEAPPSPPRILRQLLVGRALQLQMQMQRRANNATHAPPPRISRVDTGGQFDYGGAKPIAQRRGMVTDRARSYSVFYRTHLGKQVLRLEAGCVARALGRCERIIHVGCGPGFLEEALLELNILGVDVCEEMLREAREHTPGPLACADGQRLCFKDCVCDGVLFVTSLEFIDDHTLALKEAYRVLRPGGKLLVLMLNPQSDYFKDKRRHQGRYFCRVRHTDVDEVIAAAASLFTVRAEYFLGISGTSVFATSHPSLASLCAIHGDKPPSPTR